jgi:tRNA-uridine 2-sulfurtransferase
MAKIAVGMSGGVDSSVAAVLLQKAGHEVIGVTLALWRGSLCCSFEDVARAKQVAKQLGIRHYLIEALDDFRTQIVDPYVLARIQGETPNPCVSCNKLFKFGLLWDRILAREPELSALASGHYACIDFNRESQRWEVFQARDQNKDQSYMLWQLSQSQLAHSLFPLGKLQKSEVRELALEFELEDLAQKPDSQDLCFVVPNKAQFWQNEAPEACLPGEIVNAEGKVMGQHQGRVFYTPGQRRGVGGGSSERQYIVAINSQTNQLQVAPRAESLVQQLALSQVNWLSLNPPNDTLEALFKLSSHAETIPGSLKLLQNNGAEVQLQMAQMRVGQGQSIVFYDASGRLLGGGVLECAE